MLVDFLPYQHAVAVEWLSQIPQEKPHPEAIADCNEHITLRGDRYACSVTTTVALWRAVSLQCLSQQYIPVASPTCVWVQRLRLRQPIECLDIGMPQGQAGCCYILC